MTKQATFPPVATKRPPYTVDVPGLSKVDGETIPRRATAQRDGLRVIPEDGIDTLPAVLARASNKFGNAKAIGKRKLIKVHQETKKVTKVVDGKEQKVDKEWSYFELSPYEWMTFHEFEQLCQKVGAAFTSLGLKHPDRVHLFAATHPYWLAFAHGAWQHNIPIVTAYDTLGEDGLKHSLLQTRAKAIFLDPSNVSKLINPLKESEDIQVVVYNDDESPACKADADKLAKDIQALKDAHPRLKVYSFNEFTKLGDGSTTTHLPQPDDLACIMYTSGSTGTPKGVLITHKNVVGAIAGLDASLGKYFGPSDVMLNFLPLAHIFELVFENAALFWGGAMGYGHPKTISDASVRNCKGDIGELRPTLMVGVPAVWESVKKGIISKVNGSGALVRNLFWGAMSAKSMLLPYLSMVGLGTGVLDALVFKKVREATGGRLRLMMNGGGPIAKETQRFISLAIAPLLVGYGLTETCAMGVVMDPLAWTVEAMGAPTGSVEIKLVDFDDAGYHSTDNPPRGEIWIRGAPVATGGYLDLPKENEEAFTSDGWFKSGDIGCFDKEGNLSIIDRKKNLVKTQNGEYIALEKLESIYRSCSSVGNICVYADQDKSKPIAIVYPVEKALEQHAGGGKQGLETLCSDPKVNSAVLKEMQKIGRSSGFAPFEIIEGVVLTPDEWTPQNGLVTSAQKLNRKALLEKYKKDIEKAYGGN